MIILAREVKDVVHVANDVVHAVLVAYVGKIGGNLISDRLDVEQVTTVSGNHRVEERDSGSGTGPA